MVNNQFNIENKNKNDIKGITLISLVITIVIMLILASVTIAFALDQNGLMNKTKLAKEKNAQVDENKAMDDCISQMDAINSNPDETPKIKNVVTKKT